MARHFAGLDVSKEKTAICVCDAKGVVIAEMETLTSPAAIASALRSYRKALVGVAHEAGPGAIALHKGLARLRLPVQCWDARKTRAALAAQRNKTDRNDARDIAKLLARGFDANVHIKSDEANRWRALWTFRSKLKQKTRDIERMHRAVTRDNGAVCERVNGELCIRWPKRKRDAKLAAVTAPLLRAHRVLGEEADVYTQTIEKWAKDDAICRRLMTVPGVGPLIAAGFRAAIDDPHRFPHSSLVGAYLGLTSRRYQSGSISVLGRISKRGDGDVRASLYVAAQVLLLKSKSTCALRKWGLALKKRRGAKIANVAVARKLAVIMHRMWVTETDFQGVR